MPVVADLVKCLESFAPAALAEQWDNVGLLVGSADWPAARVMTCLTVTPTTVAEAIQAKADLIVTHHPLPFHPLKTITTDSTAGQILLDLIAAKIAVYSPHTAFDSAQAGINQHLAIGLGLQQIEPLMPIADEADADVGSGRMGQVGEEIMLSELASRVKTFLGIESVQVVGGDDLPIRRVAIACGSGGSFLQTAIERGCDGFVTGEMNFHGCLEAESREVGLVLPGHFASERFALLSLADYLSEQVSGIEVWSSRTEADPLRRV